MPRSSTRPCDGPASSSDGPGPGDVLSLTRSLQLLMVAVGHFRSVVADDLALTTNDSVALLVLDVHGPMPQTDLGRRLRLTSSSITSLVDRLAAVGYVERRPDPGDRRRSIVAMTGRAGRTMQDAWDAIGRHLAPELVADPRLPRSLEGLAAGLLEVDTIHG